MSRKRPYFIIHKCPVFFSGYLFAFGVPWETAVKRYQKMIGEKYEIEKLGDSVYGRLHHHVGYGNCLIWFKHVKPSLGAIMHECLHAVLAMHRISGLTLNEGSEEAYTYAMDSLGRVIEDYSK